jgi:hypothetical protein
MMATVTPPSDENRPAATMSPSGRSARLQIPPWDPAANGTHALPVHRAMPWPTLNWPAANRSPFASRSREETRPPGRPVPIAVHVEPSHRATLLAGTPPTVVKVPPAIRSPFSMTSRS